MKKNKTPDFTERMCQCLVSNRDTIWRQEQEIARLKERVKWLEAAVREGGSYCLECDEYDNMRDD